MSGKVIVVTAEQKEQIRKSYKLNQNDIDGAVDALVAWYSQQPHLPQHELDRSWVERLFITNKCSIERSKCRLDMAFAARNILPEFFDNVNPLKVLEAMNDYMQIIPLPKLNKDNTRIIVLRVIENGSHKTDVKAFFRHLFLILRYRQKYDYSMGDRYIYDTKHLTLAHLLKLYPSVMSNGETALKKVFGSRIAGVHIVNTNGILEKVMVLLKAALKPKLADRITVHAKPEDLYQLIDKGSLPNDYGGDLKSCDELSDDWNSLLCQKGVTDWIGRYENDLKSNESKRPEKSKDDEILGVAGSFRTLNFD